MKSLFLILFTSISLASFSQKASLAVVRDFWDTNIMEIVKLDSSKIIEHTNFPIEGSWGYVLGLDGDPDTWTDSDYKNGLASIFNLDLRSAIRSKSYNDLVHFENEAGELEFILQITSITSTEDGEFESSTFLYFKKYGTTWKLFKIEYAG